MGRQENWARRVLIGLEAEKYGLEDLIRLHFDMRIRIPKGFDSNLDRLKGQYRNCLSNVLFIKNELRKNKGGLDGKEEESTLTQKEWDEEVRRSEEEHREYEQDWEDLEGGPHEEDEEDQGPEDPEDEAGL